MKTTEAAPAVTTSAAPITTEAKPTAATIGDHLGRLPWEQWGASKQVPTATLRDARILHGWAEGRVLTEAQFDAAVTAARNLVFR